MKQQEEDKRPSERQWLRPKKKVPKRKRVASSMAFPDLGRAGSRGRSARVGTGSGGSARGAGGTPGCGQSSPPAPPLPAGRSLGAGSPWPVPDPHRHEPQRHPRPCPSALPRVGAAPPAQVAAGADWSLPSRGGLGPGVRGGPAPPPATPPGVAIGAGTGATAGVHGRRSDPRGQRPAASRQAGRGQE